MHAIEQVFHGMFASLNCIPDEMLSNFCVSEKILKCNNYCIYENIKK